MKNLIFTLLFLLPVLIFAQEEPQKKHPIDKWLDDCLGTRDGQSTAGMVDCGENAYQKWDKELNKLYKELMRKLNPESQKQLKEAQKAWLKYRDEEFKLLEKIYSLKDGTMYIPMQVFDRVEIIKKRTLELQGHLDLLNE